MTLLRRAIAVLAALTLLLAGAAIARAATPEDYDDTRPNALEADHLYAESAFLMDMDTGEILLSKNSRIRMYPASTTKIMTLILALESGIALDQQVTIPKEADKVPEGSSVIGIKSKDTMTWGDLLYGFMLRSGNDGSNAIAVLAAGSIDEFVNRMNRKAGELQCEGTHFVNAHGYQNENHYTTAQDLARMSVYGMKNPDFRKIVATAKCDITITRGGKSKTAEIENRNSLVVSDSNYYYLGANGIKTGHHKQAGRCVVASAAREGVNLLAVVMNADTEAHQFEDAKRLLNYGYSQYAAYSMAELLEQLQPEIATVTLENAIESDPGGGTMLLHLGDVAGGEATRMIQRNSERAMQLALDDVRSGIEVTWNRELAAPVEAGEILGSVRFAAPDGSEVSAALIASRSVEAKPEPTPTATPTLAPTKPAQAAQTGNTRAPREGHAPYALISVAVLGVMLIAGLGAYAVADERRRRRARARRRARRRRQAADASGKNAEKPVKKAR